MSDSSRGAPQPDRATPKSITTRFANIYSVAEAAPFATWHPPDALLEGDLTVPIDAPISNTKVKNLDGRLHRIFTGAIEGLCIDRPGVAIVTSGSSLGRRSRTSYLTGRRPDPTDGCTGFLGRGGGRFGSEAGNTVVASTSLLADGKD